MKAHVLWTLALCLFGILIFPPSGGIRAEDLGGQPDPALVERGEELYTEQGCGGCHTIGGGELSGPDLMNVTQRREPDWLRRWLKDPMTMVFSDPIAKDLLKQYMVPMPNLGLTEEEVEALITFLATQQGK